VWGGGGGGGGGGGVICASGTQFSLNSKMKVS